VTPSSSLQDAHAEIHCLHQILVQQCNLSAAYNNFGHAVQHTLPPTVPSAHFVQNDRPRPHYCFVHGYNVSHDGPTCRVMESDPRYMAKMKAATTPVGTGGNPNVGPPVCFPFRFPSLPVCLPCLSPTSPTKDNSKPPAPNDDTASAGLATCAAPTVRGENRPSRTRVDGPQSTLCLLSLPIHRYFPIYLDSLPLTLSLLSSQTRSLTSQTPNLIMRRRRFLFRLTRLMHQTSLSLAHNPS
jgi:hypothetical protein